MSNVKVVAFKDGSLAKVSEKNPERKFFRVESEERSFSNGNLNVTKRTATISGKTENIDAMNLHVGMQIPGRIVATESLEPAYKGQEPKTAGETGVVCTVDGQPIYRSTSFESNTDIADTLIGHDNGEEIKAAQAELAKAGSLDA